MSQAQRDLSEYLQCELYHSVGAYRVADERLLATSESLRERAGEMASLSKVVEDSAAYNRKLGFFRHATHPDPRQSVGDDAKAATGSWPARDPMPDKFPLSRERRFNVTKYDGAVQTDRDQPWNSEKSWDRIPALYTVVIKELTNYSTALKDPKVDTQHGVDEFAVARSVIAPRDGGKEPPASARLTPLERRIARYGDRRQKAIEELSPGPSGKAPDGGVMRLKDEDFLKATFASIRYGCLLSEHDDLPLYVVKAQAEAHLILHAVEAWQTMCLGEQAVDQTAQERKWLKHELKRAIVLFTFAHSVSRIAPWIFAADTTERDNVFNRVSSAWENMVPARCTWIASQIGLLALYRRGYAWLLCGKPEEAYNDFHKLQRLIRDTERRILAAPTHVDGATDFLASLTAQSHHQIGELYRDEHAHKPALKHFEAAVHGGKLVEDTDRMRAALANSRWHVELQVSRGKAAYEMGRHKEAMCWHLHAWSRFLKLLAADNGMEANTKEIDAAIRWLERVRFEPELRKSDVSDYLGPVVAQLERITVSRRFGALAAEILLRLGHLLFVLNIGRDSLPRVPQTDANPDREREAAVAEIRRTLAFDCLCKAAQCDPYCTLARADLLKAQFRFNFFFDGPLPQAYEEYFRQAPAVTPINEQWPHGRDDYERLTRVSEYLTLRARAKRFAEPSSTGPSKTDKQIDALIARHLLLDFFMNTDSTNVRKAQVHRFLMKKPSPPSLPSERDSEGIEFICMRRYSSAFPMLPRPSAFRALGGGYFVRLHVKNRELPSGDASLDASRSTEADQSEDGSMYGVVVDPGMDFIENLYRTGYCLGDINMIVVTHDHVDHLGSLDPLLSLLYERAELLDQDGKQPPKKIAVVVSRSIMRRYKHVETLSGQRDEGPSENSLFNLECFEPKNESDEYPDVASATSNGFPAGFEILAMSSAVGDERDEDKRGHRDLSGRPSHGICIRTRGDGPSLAFTSDTPSPPSFDSHSYSAWREEWAPALNADVLITHVSSVPLTELRQLDALSAESDEEVRKQETDLIKIRGRLQEADPDLKGRVDYSQWLRSGGGGGTAEIVGAVPGNWRSPRNHPYLAGTLRWAREYWKARTAKAQTTSAPPRGLLLIGELSEELGTMRGKLAARLNDHLFSSASPPSAPDTPTDGEPSSSANETQKPASFRALTADIGLHLYLQGHNDDEADSSADDPTTPRVLCATCNLDTDRVAKERYHMPCNIHEVCVKGENEGIFYNCEEHDPLSQEDPTFLEQLERFDIFGR
jgi:tetratricopeptide (TPR) repeat protein